MPRIYLSPSTQDWNPYVDGSGSEEYWMNLLADTLVPLRKHHLLCAQHAGDDRGLVHRAGEQPWRL